jgi:hypothetical protein
MKTLLLIILIIQKEKLIKLIINFLDYYNFKNNNLLVPAGFEPAPPKRPDLESGALDHSAKVPYFITIILLIEDILDN